MNPTSIEYFPTIPDDSDLEFTKTAVAFSNSKGGRIVFGMTGPDKPVKGISNESIFSVLEDLTCILVNKCTPNIDSSIWMKTVDSKTIIIVDIAPGREKPYYIKELEKELGTFIRVEDSNRLATSVDIQEMRDDCIYYPLFLT